MKNAWEIREEFNLINTVAITKEDFEAAFNKTKERIEYTFNGWDGKSYNGESRVGYAYRTNIPGYEGIRFIKVGKGLHAIDNNHLVINQQTGEYHPATSWIVDVIKG